MKATKKNKEAKENTRPIPIHTAHIVVYSNGAVAASNFPGNMNECLQLLCDVQKALMRTFMQIAKEGRLDDNGNIKKSSIVKPDKRIIMPRGNA
jgi:hypothetical protein